MSATVPPGLCESSQAHSGAFVFRIPGLPQFLYPYPSLQSARSAHSLMPGRAMPRRWVLRMRAGDCVSPAAPGESLLMMSRDQAGPGRLRGAPLLKSSRNSACPPMACHQALLKMPGTGLSRAQQGGLLRQRTASFSPRIIQQLLRPRDFLCCLQVSEALVLSAHQNSKRTPSETFASESVCSEPPKPAETPSPSLSPYCALRPAFTSQETVSEMSEVALTSGPPRFV